jgi:membrane protease YdiL (CAAX protease family)
VNSTNTNQHWKIGSYIAAVMGVTWLWFAMLKRGVHVGEAAALTVLMWIPGVMSLLFRLLFREGVRDVGWRIGKARFWAWAYFAPLALASVSISLAVVLGKVTAAPDLASQTMLDAVFFRLSWLMPNSSTLGLMGQRFLAVAIVMTVPGLLCASGEELGWRGYLLPRLVKARWPYPLLLSGVVWGVWHFPLFFLTGYAHGALALSLLMFTLLTTLFGLFIGWLRLVSGSVWVAAMAHASFNGFVQSFFGNSFVGANSWFWVGDYGGLTLITYAFLAGWLYWSGRIPVTLATEPPAK